MKVIDNGNGTWTFDPEIPDGETIQTMVEKVKAKDRKINELASRLSVLSAENTTLRAELKASREAHHETTNELRALRKKQEPEVEVNLPDLDRILDAAVSLFSGKPRKQ